MSSPSNPFLFVNETDKSPTYKVGYRADVRSHIRKHVARGLNKRKSSHGEQQVELASGDVNTHTALTLARPCDPQASPMLFCKVCGSYLDTSLIQSTPASEDHIHMPNPLWRALLKLSPQEVLGSGRVDPFSSSGQTLDPASHELMDLGM